MKRGKGFAAVFLLVLLLPVILTCTNGHLVPEPIYSCEGTLYDKSLANIRACVIGDWQMLSRSGGIGNIFEYTPDTYLTITNSDSIYYKYPNRPRQGAKISWTRIHHSYYGDTWTMGATIFVAIKSDTLSLTDYSSEPMWVVLTRKR